MGQVPATASHAPQIAVSSSYARRSSGSLPPHGGPENGRKMSRLRFPSFHIVGEFFHLLSPQKIAICK